MSFLQGKRILITGLLSNRSIAYGVAKACHAQGAELAFTYQNERFEERVREMASEFGSSLCFPCDVSEDRQIEDLFAALGQHWDRLDGLLHAIAFAPREAIAGEFLDGLSREGFRIAHEVSSYSFPALAKAALPLMKTHGGAMVTLSYLGSERVVPGYNTMGLAKARGRHALPRGEPGAHGHSRQRRVCRAHQDTGRKRHQGLWGHSGRR
jgi:enoyl-[acyl-carrier protein] reductase I